MPAGTEIAVETADGRKIIGRLGSLSVSGLVFDEVGKPTVPVEAIVTVSRRSGRPPVLKGLAVGLIAGAGIGVALWASDRADQQSCSPGQMFCGVSFGPPAAGVAAFITVLGGGIGAGVGALMSPPMKVIYRGLSLPRVSIGPLITSARRGIVFRIAF